MISRIELEADIRDILEYLLGQYQLTEHIKKQLTRLIIKLIEKKILNGEKII